MSDSIDRRRRLILGAALSGVASRAFAQADAPVRPSRAPSSQRMEPLHHVDAGVLNIGYYEAGPADGPAAILLHGFPYDIHSYVDVATLLAAQGCRVIVPYIRGFGATRFRDPARFAFAHGGKDRHPFPVPTKVYDRTIEVLETSLAKAKLGDKERNEGLSRLHRFVMTVEHTLQPEADFEELIAHEHRISPALGGRSVFGPPHTPKHESKQLRLF